MSPPSFVDVALGMLDRGPVLVLADGGHPGHRGLPAAATNATVFLQLAGLPGADTVRQGGTRVLRVRHGDAHGFDADLDLDMAGVFGLLGADPQGQPSFLLCGNPPPSLGDPPQMGVQLLLEKLGVVPRRTWTLNVDDRTARSNPAALETDKRAAFLRAREACNGSVWLLARADVPGTVAPAAQVQLPAFSVLVVPWTPGLAIDADGVRWQELAPAGPRAIVVPWAAISVLQSPDYQRGWAWIDDLPDEMLADPRLAQLRHLPGGLPLLPPELPAHFVVAQPHHVSPRDAGRQVLALSGMMLIDRHHPGMHAPRGLEGQHVIAVPIAVGPAPSAYIEDAQGFVATMPDAQGRVALVRVPWGALLAASVAGLAPRIWTFHEHASDALLQSLPATDVPGQQVFKFDQPMGTVVAGTPTTLHIEYIVQRNMLH